MAEFSFSYNVKKEIIEKINSREKADVCLMGMLTFCNILSDKEILLMTENKLVADFFVKNVCRILQKNDSVCIDECERREDCILYSLRVDNEQDRIFLLDYFQTDSGRRLAPDDLPKEKYFPQLVAGIFLACGSVNNPEKKYHMEFVMPSLDLCNDFGRLLIENYGITPKETMRKSNHVVYIKESENIIDMLTLMGASMSAIEIMNVKIEKDMRNKINRAVNCENANVEKTIKAAEKQLVDIELIDSTLGLDNLPDALRDTAIARYENPDYNLKQLGEVLNPPISRSGVNHRLRKIAEIADKIRKEKGL